VVRQIPFSSGDHVACAARWRPHCTFIRRSRSKLRCCFCRSRGTVALFVLGVTVALRPSTVPWEVPASSDQMLIHRLIVFGFDAVCLDVARLGATAVLMASLPPALNVFVVARQNDTWIEPVPSRSIGTFPPSSR